MKKVILSFLLGFAAIAYSAKAQTSSPTPAATADTTALKEYAGKYKFEGLPFEFMEFSLKQGSLTVQAGDQGAAIIPSKETADRFETADSVAKFSFIRNEEKKVTKVIVDYQGTIFEGKKE